LRSKEIGMKEKRQEEPGVKEANWGNRHHVALGRE